MKAINYYCQGIGNLDLTNFQNGMCKRGVEINEVQYIPSYFYISQMLIRSLFIQYSDLKCKDIISKCKIIFKRGVEYSFKVIINMEGEDDDIIIEIIKKIAHEFYKYDDHIKYGKIIFFVLNFNNEIESIENVEIYKMQNLQKHNLETRYIYFKANSYNINLLFTKVNKSYLQDHILVIDLHENLELLNDSDFICWIKKKCILKREKNIRFLPGYLNVFLLGEWEGILNPVELAENDITLKNYNDLNQVIKEYNVGTNFLYKFYSSILEKEK